MGSVEVRLVIHGLTDIGLARSRNEDAIAWDEGRGLLVLADGMGGHLAGDVASRMAVEVILEELHAAPGALSDAVTKANAAIHRQAQGSLAQAGMGTTVVVAHFEADRVTVGHVGDSRFYRYRAGTLEQLTADHSLVQELVRDGFLTFEQAQASVSRNVITRALGIDPEVDVEVHEHPVEPGDRYLACSDGLTDLVADEEIALALGQHRDLSTLARGLIDAANGKGGTDNISVIVVEVADRD